MICIVVVVHTAPSTDDASPLGPANLGMKIQLVDFIFEIYNIDLKLYYNS